MAIPPPISPSIHTEGPIHFHDYIEGSWAVLFSHPKNFTPICTTELGYTAKLKPEFDKRGVKVLGLSVDKLEDHGAWAKDIEETQGTALNFPLLADTKREVAKLYDMIHPNADNTLTVRSVFVIGPDKKVKLKIEYPASTGRNFDEVIRVIDSLQLTAKYSVATPVNWKNGEDVIIACFRLGRSRQGKVPRWLEGTQALSSHCSSAPRVNLQPALVFSLTNWAVVHPPPFFFWRGSVACFTSSCGGEVGPPQRRVRGPILSL